VSLRPAVLTYGGLSGAADSGSLVWVSKFIRTNERGWHMAHSATCWPGQRLSGWWDQASAQGAVAEFQGRPDREGCRELHSGNNINKQTALTEKGETVNGYGDQPNKHDILTGSQPDGTAFAATEDRTARTGRRVPKEPRWSDIPTLMDLPPIRRLTPGIRRILREVPMGAAAKRI
jgi:hypothetical protein